MSGRRIPHCYCKNYIVVIVIVVAAAIAEFLLSLSFSFFVVISFIDRSLHLYDCDGYDDDGGAHDDDGIRLSKRNSIYKSEPSLIS